LCQRKKESGDPEKLHKILRKGTTGIVPRRGPLRMCGRDGWRTNAEYGDEEKSEEGQKGQGKKVKKMVIEKFQLDSVVKREIMEVLSAGKGPANPVEPSKVEDASLETRPEKK